MYRKKRERKTQLILQMNSKSSVKWKKAYIQQWIESTSNKTFFFLCGDKKVYKTFQSICEWKKKEFSFKCRINAWRTDRRERERKKRIKSYFLLFCTISAAAVLISCATLEKLNHFISLPACKHSLAGFILFYANEKI